MFVECAKRIFGRKDHDCLSSSNKEKVVEVLLKFVRLYDGIQFNNSDLIGAYFDHFIYMDFLHLRKRDALDQQTLKTIVEGVN